VSDPLRPFVLTALIFLFSSPLLGQSPFGSPHSVFAGTGKSSRQDRAYPPGKPSGAPTRIDLGNPFGIEVLGRTIWITSVDDHCIYRGTIDGGPLIRVAGNGLVGYSGDGGAAVDAQFNWPHEVRADSDGNLFVADTRNHVIRRIDGRTGVVTTIAGNGAAGFAGDGESGGRVQFKQPHSVVLDGNGGLLVADTVNHRLRRIDLDTGTVETISGTGEKRLPRDGADARTSPLFGPRSLAVDSDSIWIALREGNSIWRIDRDTGKLQHIAGTGKKGYRGDGGPPLEATFHGPKGLVIDDQKRLLVVDTENHAVRRIDLVRNNVQTVLGGSAAARSFSLRRPHGIAFAPSVGYFVADSESHRVLLGR
jgi:DNA-binding beta-propeller fold protein YncE